MICDINACWRCANTPESTKRSTFRYLAARERGGKLGERLSPASLAALSAVASKHSVQTLLSDASIKF